MKEEYLFDKYVCSLHVYGQDKYLLMDFRACALDWTAAMACVMDCSLQCSLFSNLHEGEIICSRMYMYIQLTCSSYVSSSYVTELQFPI